MKKEHRVYPRLLVHLAGEYRVGTTGPWHRCDLRDLSAAGATLITPDRISPESVVYLRFDLPGEPTPSAPVEIETLVLRADAQGAVAGNLKFREALYFLDLASDAHERLRRYVFVHQQAASI